MGYEIHHVRTALGGLRLACDPGKQPSVVNFMKQFGRASTDWEEVNCEKCKAGQVPVHQKTRPQTLDRTGK